LRDIETATKERIRRAGRAYVAPVVDRQLRNTTPARVRDRFQQLHDAGRITEMEAAAGRRFERNAEMATRATVTASYGTRHAEGTPISQQSEQAWQEDAARRVDWYGNHKRDVDVVGAADWDWWCRFLQGEGLHRLGGDMRAKGWSSRAIARAHVRLRKILGRLAVHYWPHVESSVNADNSS